VPPKKRPRSPPAHPEPTLNYPEEHLIDIGTISKRYDHVHYARSETGFQRFHKVNLHRVTCTCPDFQNRRKDLAPNDVRRICTHIAETLIERRIDSELPPLVRLIIRHARKVQKWHHVQFKEGEIAFGFSLDSPWINVIAVINSDSLASAYNIREKHWAYPYREDEIRDKHESLILSEMKKRFFLSWKKNAGTGGEE